MKRKAIAMSKRNYTRPGAVRLKKRTQEELVRFLEGACLKEGYHVHRFPSDSTIHLRVKGVDFWPATHRFYSQHSGVGGNGLLEFLRMVGVPPPSEGVPPEFFRKHVPGPIQEVL